RTATHHALRPRTTRPPPHPRPLPYTTLFRSQSQARAIELAHLGVTDLRCILPNTPDVHDAIAQLTAIVDVGRVRQDAAKIGDARSEEHTSELQSRGHLVCRLLLEKKKTKAHR